MTEKVYGRVENLDHYNDLNNDHISATNFLRYAILKASMTLKQQDHNKAIEHYDAIRCKFRQIGIHNVIDYNLQRKNHTINSLLIRSKLFTLHSYIFALIDSEILQASYI